MIEPLPAQEAIVLKNIISGTNSLSAIEWQSMEAAMTPEERLTHRNLSLWMAERAKQSGVKEQPEEEEDDDDDAAINEILMNGEGKEPEGGAAAPAEDDDEDEAPAADSKKKQEEEDAAAVGTIDKQKNW